MNKLILHMITSMDGFIANRHGSGPAPDGAGWDEEVQQLYLDLFSSAGVLVYGRGIYNPYVGHWRKVASGEIPAMNDIELRWTKRLMKMPKYLLSQTQSEAFENTAILRNTDAIAGIKKEAKGDVLLLCGPKLFAELTAKRPIDQYMLYIGSVAVGRGVHLFQDMPDSIKLKFEKITPFNGGMNLHYYTPEYAN